MNEVKKPTGIKRKWVTRVLLVVLFGLTYWAYQQFTTNYQNLENSNQVLSSSLNTYMDLTKQYARDIAAYKDNLVKTEATLKNVQSENNQLKQKLALLGTLTDLQSTVEELKAKNLALANELSDFKKKSPYVDPQNIKTIQDGKNILTKYRESVHKVKARLAQINREEQKKRIAAKQEQDRLISQMGNNGFVLRDGKPTKMEVVLPNSDKTVNINVKFVE